VREWNLHFAGLEKREDLAMIEDTGKNGVALLDREGSPAEEASSEYGQGDMRQVAAKRTRQAKVEGPLSSLADNELVARFLDGNAPAFPELVSLQETFIRVYRHLHRFDQAKKFSTWIYTIASNLAKNELRNRSRNPLVLFQAIKKNWEADHRPLQWEDPHYRPDDLFRKRHLRDMVEKAVQELPEHHRAVFVLREMEGKTYEEISEITGVNLGTVKSRLNRARNNFAQIIAPMLR
jgi:RNA polymerase sigma-70 factor (ECF subfamily)